MNLRRFRYKARCEEAGTASSQAPPPPPRAPHLPPCSEEKQEKHCLELQGTQEGVGDRVSKVGSQTVGRYERRWQRDLEVSGLS